MKPEFMQRLAELERKLAAMERAARIADTKVDQAKQARKTHATK